MSIINNAVESIQIGVEDYGSADERRHLSAVRNVTAGLLLLFKEKLRRLSPAHEPELLLKRDLSPRLGEDGVVVFGSTGRKTVDVFQIEQRFQRLKVHVDWKLFGSISEIRNEVEHYYTVKSKDAVREALSKSFVIIRDFLVEELEEDPRGLLGDKCWDALLQVSRVFKREEEECEKTLQAVDWKYQTLRECIHLARCPLCGSSLVRPLENGEYSPSLEMACVSCGNTFKAPDVVEACIDEYLGADAYAAVKDGQEPPYGECPQCNRDTFVIAERACVACEGALDYEECNICGTDLGLEDQDLDGMCSYCHYRMEKMRDE